MEEKKAKDILDEVKSLDDSLAHIIVPMLKDTIQDYRKLTTKLIAVIIVLIICITTFSAYAIYKHYDFFNQFDYESEVYTQDTGDYSDINDGIYINSNKN